MGKEAIRNKPVSRTAMQRIALKLVDRLASMDMWLDVRIYAGGNMYASDMSSPYDLEAKTKRGTKYFVSRCDDPSIYVEGADPRTISMTFEGPLYEWLNYAAGGQDWLYGISNEYLAPYGLYFDMVNAFTMSACRI